MPEPMVTTGGVDYDPTAPAVLADPLPFYETLRASCPVHLFDGLEHPLYTLSRREDVHAMLTDTDLWSNRFGPGISYSEQNPGSLQRYDPPEHTLRRRFLREPFLPRAVEQFEPAVAALGRLAHRRLRRARPGRAARRLRVAAPGHRLHPPARPAARGPSPLQALGREAHARHDLPRPGERPTGPSCARTRSPRSASAARPLPPPTSGRTTIRSAPWCRKGSCRTWPATASRTAPSPRTTRSPASWR